MQQWWVAADLGETDEVNAYCVTQETKKGSTSSNYIESENEVKTLISPLKFQNPLSSSSDASTTVSSEIELWNPLPFLIMEGQFKFLAY